jgi:hypothetical protein
VLWCQLPPSQSMPVNASHCCVCRKLLPFAGMFSVGVFGTRPYAEPSILTWKISSLKSCNNGSLLWKARTKGETNRSSLVDGDPGLRLCITNIIPQHYLTLDDARNAGKLLPDEWGPPKPRRKRMVDAQTSALAKDSMYLRKGNDSKIGSASAFC